MVRLSRSSQQRASRGLCGARRSGKAARSASARAARRISTSPPGPSSPRAVARTLASTTITIGAQRRHCRLQRHRTSRAAARPVKDLIKGRFAGLLDEPGPQVLLKGLVRGSCALTQDSMSLLGHVLDLHAGHGAIMALEAPVRKRAVIRHNRASPRRVRQTLESADRRIAPPWPLSAVAITALQVGARPICPSGGSSARGASSPFRTSCRMGATTRRSAIWLGRVVAGWIRAPGSALGSRSFER
jgi:hypothetical protein